MPGPLLCGFMKPHPYVACRAADLAGEDPIDVIVRARLAVATLSSYQVIEAPLSPLYAKMWQHVLIVRNKNTGAKLALCTDNGESYFALTTQGMRNEEATMILNTLVADDF